MATRRGHTANEQGVPALFRWLSKKYPKIVQSVEEEEPRRITGDDGVEVELPIDKTRPNPNGEEFDCLYLDMNGIVHPCTHPEGKPAPETEEEMMVEVFKYTERVIDMIRPRKLLMLAIDGVAPRAKMNQQRSRRFRSAQDAKVHHEELQRELEERKRRGLAADEEDVKRSWDSNAITPGTPFMDLLATSLRYWIAQKLNTDPAWKNLSVVLSDASVPGEGEHKIMDYIRRKRCDPNHDPNMRHVIYGLDADLIMLSLATHEPYFKVLREDVFAQDAKNRGCRRCGQEGHIASQCTGEARSKAPATGRREGKKPFIFLDVPTLREYLEIELQTPNMPFPFDLERAIDDWVFLIFFVGNDFLPHLPSLEIREGAIDTLLKIWKRELPRMSGYLTNSGKVELGNAQIILDGLAQTEDDIFRRRKQTEDRQDANAKRRRMHEQRSRGGDRDSFEYGGTEYVAPKSEPRSQPKPIPPPPSNKAAADAAASAEKKGGVVMLDGSSSDVVKNRAQIRMANISAAESIKASLLAKKKGGKPEKDTVEPASAPAGAVKSESAEAEVKAEPEGAAGSSVRAESHVKAEPGTEGQGPGAPADASNDSGMFKLDEDLPKNADHAGNMAAGKKRAFGEVEAPSAETSRKEEGEEENDEEEEEDEDEDENDTQPKIEERVVRPDGTVEYEDKVKLWEPGYRERYYQQKFGVDASDAAFKRKIVQAYVEGLCWVLAYYYQGCPSWKWYYPYHFSPFAADFTDIASMDIRFDKGTPFRPFEQLMGVLPAASRTNLPAPFQKLMTDEESEILDFYPTEFQIDMNGKKMAWQGVALLPFIDEERLLAAMARRYAQLTDDEIRRNSFGHNILFIAEDSPLFAPLSRLYAKRSKGGPEPLDTSLDNGVAGVVSPDPSCVPGSTLYSPLTSLEEMRDIHNDHSLSVFLDFPTQTHPHRSVLLRGVRPPRRRLNYADADYVRRGGGPGGPGGGRGGRGGRASSGGWGSTAYGRDAMPASGPAAYGSGPYGGYGGYPSYGQAGAANPRGPYGGAYGGYNAAGGYCGYGGYGYGSQYGGNQYGGYPGYQQGYGGGYPGYGGYQGYGGYGNYQGYGGGASNTYGGYGDNYGNYGGYGAPRPRPPRGNPRSGPYGSYS